MPLTVPSIGELELLDRLLKDTLSQNEDYLLKLYQNNYSPDANSASGSFTAATFTNYAARTLTRAGWNSAVMNSGKAESSYSTAPLSWTCGASGNTLYGYWVEGSMSGKALWAEKFTTARVLASGDVLNLTPVFSLQSEA